jgi:hypothetical protein
VRLGHVEFAAAHISVGVRAIRGGNCDLSQHNTCEGSCGESGPVVIAWTAGRTLPGFVFWTSAPKRASACMERHRDLAYCAVGCVGRPASAIIAGETGNAVALTRGSPGFTGTTGPPGHPISEVR